MATLKLKSYRVRMTLDVIVQARTAQEAKAIARQHSSGFMSFDDDADGMNAYWTENARPGRAVVEHRMVWKTDDPDLIDLYEDRVQGGRDDG